MNKLLRGIFTIVCRQETERLEDSGETKDPFRHREEANEKDISTTTTISAATATNSPDKEDAEEFWSSTSLIQPQIQSACPCSYHEEVLPDPYMFPVRFRKLSPIPEESDMELALEFFPQKLSDKLFGNMKKKDSWESITRSEVFQLTPQHSNMCLTFYDDSEITQMLREMTTYCYVQKALKEKKNNEVAKAASSSGSSVKSFWS